jgi:hypothetical protein
LLPCLDGPTKDWVDGLGERGSGFVSWDVEQADGVFRKHITGAPGDSHVLGLPAGAPDPESRYLIAALSTEEPGQGDRPDQFDGVRLP